MLILKRNPDARYTESYNVLFEGRSLGRIYKATSHAPRERPWFWGLNLWKPTSSQSQAAQPALSGLWVTIPPACRPVCRTVLSSTVLASHPAAPPPSTLRPIGHLPRRYILVVANGTSDMGWQSQLFPPPSWASGNGVGGAGSWTGAGTQLVPMAIINTGICFRQFLSPPRSHSSPAASAHSVCLVCARSGRLSPHSPVQRSIQTPA